MPLYGHELSPSINPYEAGLGIFVKLEKPDFIGKAALERARPVSRRRVGLQMTGRGIAREGCPVYDGGRAGGRGHLRHPLPLGGTGGGPGPGGRGVQGTGHPAPGGRAGPPGGRPGGQNALLPAGIRANRPRRAAAPSQLIL